MAWFTRLTRFGDVHLVYGQEHDMSCGIASVLMCIFKLNKLVPGRTSVATEKAVIADYQRRLGSNYDAEKTGTYPEILASILKSYTGKNWGWLLPQPEEVPQMLVDQVGVTSGLGATLAVKPVILGVDWDQGGAHWVVVDTIRTFMGSTYATLCDPWDTNVHMQAFSTGSPFLYDAASGGFMMNMWGSNKGTTQPYKGNAAKGQVKTWGMIAP